MPRRLIVLISAALTLSLAPAAVALAGPARVSIRVEGQNTPLIAGRTLLTQSTPFTKDGNPADVCSGTSAGGALEQATHGNWAGTYSKSLGYFVTTIQGEQHPGSPDYWALWVNDRQASAGACTTELRAGDRVLFFVDSCTYDAAKQGCSNQPVLPLGLRVSKRTNAGRRVTVSVVVYSASGKAAIEPGASVYVGKHRVGITDAKGQLRLTLHQRGKLTLTAKKLGTVRSDAQTLRVR